MQDVSCGISSNVLLCNASSRKASPESVTTSRRIIACEKLKTKKMQCRDLVLR